MSHSDVPVAIKAVLFSLWNLQQICHLPLFSELLEVNFVNFHFFNNKHFFAGSLALRHMVVMERTIGFKRNHRVQG